MPRSHSRPRPLRALHGSAHYALLSTIGALSSRSEQVAELDGRRSTRRRMRDELRQDALDAADPRSLRWSEWGTYSQNGEDGVIAEIFERIGTTRLAAIEIGASDGRENCTRNLVEQGWRVVWVEADPDAAARAEEVASPEVTIVAEPAHRDSVVAQLRAAGAPDEPDLLVVDIDGDDLGILRPCLDAFRPRVVVVEYNAVFSPGAIWSTSPRRAGGWDGTFRHGASLGALDEAARARGYDLVHCDRAGVNAFFVRRDLAADHFSASGDLERHFRVGSFSVLPFGHPRARDAVEPMAPLTSDEVSSITLRPWSTNAVRTRAGGPVPIDVVVQNGTAATLTSGMPGAVHVSVRWLSDPPDLPPDAPRAPLPRPVGPGAAVRLHLLTTAPSEPGRAIVRVTVVVEGVAWREALGGTGAMADVIVDVLAPADA